MMLTPQYQARVDQFMAALSQTCRARRVPDPNVRDVHVSEREGRAFSFALFPDGFNGKLEAYTAAGFLHQLSTTLKGAPITYSNHTGFRLVAQIDGWPEPQPTRLAYPGHLAGHLRLGVDQAGREVRTPWARVGHGLIVGMTGSGKTSTLRVIIADALADHCRLMLGDLHDSTFPMLAGHPALLAPIAHSVAEYSARLEALREVKQQRQAAYVALHQRGIYPDDLDEYNAAVEPAQRLPRIVAVFDEFSTACDQDRGAQGPLAHLAFQLAIEVRKFGIHLIFAGQTINADLVGPMRDQITTLICFQVARKEISRTVVRRPGAELFTRPGQGLTLNGRLQAYYLDKQVMIDLARAGVAPEPAVEAAHTAPLAPAIPAVVLDLARRCLQENDGRLTLTWLHTTGLGQQAARRVQAEWTEQGWAVCDPARDNARCVGLSVCQALNLGVERWSGDTPTNPTNPTNRPESPVTNRQTGSAPGDKPTNRGDRPDKPAAEGYA